MRLLLVQSGVCGCCGTEDFTAHQDSSTREGTGATGAGPCPEGLKGQTWAKEPCCQRYFGQWKKPMSQVPLAEGGGSKLSATIRGTVGTVFATVEVPLARFFRRLEVPKRPGLLPRFEVPLARFSATVRATVGMGASLAQV